MSTDLEASLDAIIDESGFSGVVQVARGDDVLYARAAGDADRAHGIPNGFDTQLAIASGTKGLTALTAMSLVSEGALDLELPVRNVLGDALPLVDSGVTVGHLLAHTSGIGDYLDEEADGEITDYVFSVPVHELAEPTDYLSVLDGFPTKFGPGTRFSYCNGGYVLLAIVIEAVSSTSYYDLVDERVCAPAGMRRTEFLRSDQLPGAAALGYVPDEAGWRTNVLHLPVRGAGDGGAYSTLADVSAFWRALLAGEIVPRPVVDEMVRPHHDAPSEHLRAGLGFWLREDRPTVMLEGFDAGVSFRTAHDPSSAVEYTVIANTSDGAWPLVRELDARLPELAGE